MKATTGLLASFRPRKCPKSEKQLVILIMILQGTMAYGNLEDYFRSTTKVIE
jgi:hypothetical protein